MHPTSVTLESQLEKVRELESRLTFRLSVLSKLLDKQSQEFLQGTELNLSSYRILAVVRTFNAISISDISRFNAMDRGQVSRAAIELEKLRLVNFRADVTSKRKKLVVLTDEGHAILEHVQPKFDAYRDSLEAALGPDDLSALSSGLGKLTEFISK